MDWGLAKVVGEHSEAFLLGEDPVVTGRMESGLVTLAGMVQGTPAYMSPEQARGELELIDARTDVYCLGAVLYELLSFQPPHRGRTVEEILDAARASNPPPPSQAAPKGVKVPPDLEAICMKALARERDERYASTREFQEDLQSYIEGTRDRDRRRSEALKLLAEARKHIAAYKELERKRARLKMEVAKVAETIQSHDAVDKKKMLWAIEDATKKLEVDAAKESSAGRNSLHAAIQADPECAEARRTLADLYWERFLEAEGHRDLTTAEFYRGLVEASDDGRYAPLLQGDGKLSVQTTPSGADATLYRFVEEERILRPREPRLLGRTPFNPLSIPMGSYLLVLRKEGYRDVRYPVSMGRGESHAARVRLYPEAEIGKEFLYVPAGEFLRGGDRESWSGFEGGRVAVGDFFIARFPVTMGEYCAFLDALRDRGAAVAEHIPRQGEQVYVELGPDGKYRSSPEFLEGEAASQSSPEVARSCPVLALSWDSAMEYARWRSGIDGREYSLPPEDAWEKAARGVDGRFYPWGDHFEWTFVKGGLSRSGRAQPEPVGSFPADESPYGVRDMAGTIREWTSSWFNEKSGLRAVRGGSWNQVAAWQFRCATRFGFRPSARTTTFGFRLHARPPAAG
jgi:serine/threonine-protein kinase